MSKNRKMFGLSRWQAFVKRSFDIVLALTLLILFGWLILVLVALATIDTGEFGIFRQKRKGQLGNQFTLFKIRSMRPSTAIFTVVTTKSDSRITAFGAVLRRLKLDELPQLWNVLWGDMSFVGPRPDVEKSFDIANVDQQNQLFSVRPGLTGAATLLFFNEEEILDSKEDPEYFSTNVLMPIKIEANILYIENYSFASDVQILFQTAVRVFSRKRNPPEVPPRFADLLANDL